ncbi:unnamed protein product [Symbiodinium pilosum]|uniref:Uncharacterized protein n=1 Tax=Symbiodinium pilosum TaxID=2952 RepID=A0A812REZ0_SYMPI|nr:unnamed protein product [Symbiodinium pilosum]
MVEWGSPKVDQPVVVWPATWVLCKLVAWVAKLVWAAAVAVVGAVVVVALVAALAALGAPAAVAVVGVAVVAAVVAAVGVVAVAVPPAAVVAEDAQACAEAAAVVAVAAVAVAVVAVVAVAAVAVPLAAEDATAATPVAAADSVGVLAMAVAAAMLAPAALAAVRQILPTAAGPSQRNLVPVDQGFTGDWGKHVDQLVPLAEYHDGSANCQINVNSHVDTGFSVVFGLFIACWYFATRQIGLVCSEGADACRAPHFVAAIPTGSNRLLLCFLLKSKFKATERSTRGLPFRNFLKKDYFAGVSQEFAEAAAALEASLKFVPKVLNPHDGGGAKQPEFVDGAELARKLIASRCPEALSSFKVFTTVGGSAPSKEARPKDSTGSASSMDECIQQIAKEHRISARRVVLFTASKDLVRDGADESWTAIHVPNSAEGFRFDDVQLPSNSDSGLFQLPEVMLKQAHLGCLFVRICTKKASMIRRIIVKIIPCETCPAFEKRGAELAAAGLSSFQDS